MYKLKKRVKYFFTKENIIINHRVNAIVDDSRLVKLNDIYFCCEKNEKKALNYIKEAAQKGAKTIVSVHKFACFENSKNINFIETKNIYNLLSKTTLLYYKKLLKGIKLVGITGTNGKTTVTSIIFRYLISIGEKAALIGTNGYFYVDKNKKVVNVPLPNTTPNLLKIIEIIKKANLSKGFCIMEVSSQALAKHRVLGLKYDVVGFTQITSDHLDYHKTTDNYVATKQKLIYYLKKDGILILNSNCKHVLHLNNETTNETLYYGKVNETNNYTYKLEFISKNEMTFKVFTKNDDTSFKTKLLGEYNVENITLAYAVLDNLKVSLQYFKFFIDGFNDIPGRQNMFYVKNNKVRVVIDYAHTPSAFEGILSTFIKIKEKRLITVFGCGGDRDKEKRPEMGRIAALYSDYVIVTTDNPRSENEKAIIEDIVKGISDLKYETITNRFQAIKKAYKTASDGDIILILGKGCEKGTIDNFGLSDLEIIKKCDEGSDAL